MEGFLERERVREGWLEYLFISNAFTSRERGQRLSMEGKKFQGNTKKTMLM